MCIFRMIRLFCLYQPSRLFFSNFSIFQYDWILYKQWTYSTCLMPIFPRMYVNFFFFLKWQVFQTLNDIQIQIHSVPQILQRLCWIHYVLIPSFICHQCKQSNLELLISFSTTIELTNTKWKKLYANWLIW